MAIDLYNETEQSLPFKDEAIESWISFTLKQQNNQGNLCVCFVDERAMADTNGQYRNQNKPTNVLSFPSDLPAEIQSELNFLGDILICPSVLAKEAIQLNKPLYDHWAHICVHAVLHLLGYDHTEASEAKIMQTLETTILDQLDVPDPYCEIEGAKS